MILALGTFSFVLTTAEAGYCESKRRISTCGGCGHGVYAYWRCVGHRPCGTPVYQWVPAYHNGCRSHGHGHHHGHGYRPSYSYPRYTPSYRYRQPSYCQPRRGSYFSFSFGSRR